MNPIPTAARVISAMSPARVLSRSATAVDALSALQSPPDFDSRSAAAVRSSPIALSKNWTQRSAMHNVLLVSDSSPRLKTGDRHNGETEVPLTREQRENSASSAHCHD